MEVRTLRKPRLSRGQSPTEPPCPLAGRTKNEDKAYPQELHCPHLAWMHSTAPRGTKGLHSIFYTLLIYWKHIIKRFVILENISVVTSSLIWGAGSAFCLHLLDEDQHPPGNVAFTLLQGWLSPANCLVFWKKSASLWVLFSHKLLTNQRLKLLNSIL